MPEANVINIKASRLLAEALHYELFGKLEPITYKQAAYVLDVCATSIRDAGILTEQDVDYLRRLAESLKKQVEI